MKSKTTNTSKPPSNKQKNNKKSKNTITSKRIEYIKTILELPLPTSIISHYGKTPRQIGKRCVYRL